MQSEPSPIFHTGFGTTLPDHHEWDTDSVLNLANRQRRRGSEGIQMTVRHTENPKLILRKSFLDCLPLSDNGAGDSVRVTGQY